MVSSRCVAGLSTGIRPVSASSTMNIAMKASAWDGSRNFQPGSWLARTIWLRLVEPAEMARVKMASIIAGSAMAERVISRLLPMPAECARRVQSPQREEEPAQRQQSDQRQRAAEEAQRRLRGHHRHQQPRA